MFILDCPVFNKSKIQNPKSKIETMLYMIVENFKDEREVYRRFREKGRMMPAGLDYVSSWTDTDFTQCFQLMETENVKLFDEWMANWSDIVDFEIFPVMSSKDAAEKIAERF